MTNQGYSQPPIYQQTSTMAVISLISGIASFFILPVRRNSGDYSGLFGKERNCTKRRRASPVKGYHLGLDIGLVNTVWLDRDLPEHPVCLHKGVLTLPLLYSICKWF